VHTEKEEERLQRERESQLAEEEKEVLHAIHLSKQEVVERELASLQATIPPEPPANAEGVCTLAIRLPSGDRVHRRLLAHHTIGDLRSFVRCQRVEFGELAVPANFVIVMDYPRRQFDDDTMTLRDAGMCPRAAVIILARD
jgi:hypothetical protein